MTAEESLLWREAVDALVREFQPAYTTVQHLGRVFHLTQLWPELAQALSHVAKLAPGVSKNAAKYPDARDSIPPTNGYEDGVAFRQAVRRATVPRETLVTLPTGIPPQGWQALDDHGIRKRWYPPRHG